MGRFTSSRVAQSPFKELMSIDEMESLDVADSAHPFSTEGSVDTNLVDIGLCKEEKPVCFHCSKILEFYMLRAETITFPSLQLQTKLRSLRTLRMSNWNEKDVEFLVNLYRQG